MQDCMKEDGKSAGTMQPKIRFPFTYFVSLHLPRGGVREGALVTPLLESDGDSWLIRITVQVTLLSSIG